MKTLDEQLLLYGIIVKDKDDIKKKILQELIRVHGKRELKDEPSTTV